MGAAAMVGLGLAIARPDRRVLVVTGDGEMLMGLGSLATIGVQRPPNLAIAVFDNGHYARDRHAAEPYRRSVSRWPAIARACGFKETFDITDELGAARVFRAASTTSATDSVRSSRDPRRRAAARAAAARRRFPEEPFPPRDRRGNLTLPRAAGVSSPTDFT